MNQSVKQKILIVEDEKETRNDMRKELSKQYTVFCAKSKKECLKILPENIPDVIILDLNLPDTQSEFELLDHIRKEFPYIPIIIVSCMDRLSLAKQANQLGVKEYILKTEYSLDHYILKNTIEKVLTVKNLKAANDAFSHSAKEEIYVPKVQIYETIYKIARQALQRKLSLLLIGEEGTGKKTLVRYLQNEIVPAVPIVILDCTKLLKSISEQDLFKKPDGIFEMAKQGILFIENIDKLPKTLHKKILSHFEKESAYIIISASRKPIDPLVKQDLFNRDFFEHINQMELQMPNLRDNPDLLKKFITYFTKKYNDEYNISFKYSTSLLKFFMARKWEGNIEELKLEIKRMIIAYADGVSYDELKLQFLENDQHLPVKKEGLPGLIKQVEKNCIEETLRKNNFNKALTARILKITRTTLHHKIEEYKIKTRETLLDD